MKDIIFRKRYANIAFAVFMSLFMGTLMPFFVTLLNLGGFVEDFLFRWFMASITAMPIALVISIFVVPIVKRIVDSLFVKD